MFNELGTVTWTFIVVMAAIVIDTILGAIKAIKVDYDNFDFRELPRFLATGILPYVGGLGVVALGAEFLGEPFSVLFYAAATATMVKYVAEIKDKIMEIFGINLTSDGGIGDDV